MRIPAFLIRLFADRLIARAKLTPYYHLDGYMNRYWLVPYIHHGSAKIEGDGTGPVGWSRPFSKLLQYFGIGIRVHEILRSDAGALHNHPWGYVSVILKGAYIETCDDAWGEYDRGFSEGDVLVRSAKSRHRLTVPGDDTPVTTLFITARATQQWGFFPNGEFVPHRSYKGQR